MSILESFFESVNSLGPFEEESRIAVAVSGGSDSMALALMLSEWCLKNHYSMQAILVDHQLRKTSREEINLTIQRLEENNISSHILTIDPKEIGTSNIQENARQQRYKLLTEYCRQNNIIHLFTGHTCNDQIENFFIRLTRGTSLNGLAGISKISIQNEIRILRPVLGFYKHNLQDFLKSRKIEWIEDPSNQNKDFTRVKARELIGSDDFLSLSNQNNQEILFNRIRNIIDDLKETKQDDEYQLLSLLANSATFYEEGYCKIDTNKFSLYKRKICIRAISHIIRTVGHQANTHLVRLESLENIIEALGQKDDFKRTLGKCVIKYLYNKNEMLFLPENGVFSYKKMNNDTFLVNKKYKLSGYNDPEICKFHSNKHTIQHLPKEIREQLFQIDSCGRKKIVSFIDNEHYNSQQLEFFPQVGLAENLFDN